MNFDGFVKHLGTIDMGVIEPIAFACQHLNWKDDCYSRDEHPLVDGRLIEFPYIIKKHTLSVEQEKFIEQCLPLVEFASTFFPGYVKVRGEIATLLPNTELDWHADIHWFQKFSHRIHIPIISNNESVQLWDDYSEHLYVGNIYEVNNRKHHSARNTGSSIRTHIILDFSNPNIWYPFVDNGGDPLTCVVKI